MGGIPPGPVIRRSHQVVAARRTARQAPKLRQRWRALSIATPVVTIGQANQNMRPPSNSAMPVSLSDAELATVMDGARPLAPNERAAFLREVAAELVMHPKPLGPGTVHRLVREMQRRYFKRPSFNGRSCRMNDDDDFKQVVLPNTREWNGFWFWRDKLIGERGAARNILEAAGIQVDGLTSLDQDPPDCEAMLDGQFSGIEVTELVNRAMLERSIRAVRQRWRGEEPQKPEAYFDWDRDDLIAALQELLVVKNSAKLKRSYEQYVLVIHTGEFFLSGDSVERFLKGAIFNTSLITHAFLGLSYEPGKGYPVFELKLVRH